MHLPIAETEAAILDAVERDLLAPALFDDVLDLAVSRLSRQTDTAGLEAERDRLAREIGNLVAALAQGGDVPALAAELRTRESRKGELDRRLSTPCVTVEGLRADLAARLSDWRRLLRSRPTHGQRVLRAVLDGPIQVGIPTKAGVPWEARGSYHGLLGTLSNQVASPTGTDPWIVAL